MMGLFLVITPRMNNRSPNIIFIAMALTAAYLIFSQFRHETRVKDQLREIESIRKALQDSVSILKKTTARRDRDLREAIRRDMELVDTLNATLSRLNRSSREIDIKIELNKKAIDRLWNDNNFNE